ncbi:MAG TPA: M28 family peptidase [Bacteroidia bacterium]|nr:M28 family peptidase [Bacteroidia bacterium]HNP97640.1 M28 family peptidase [Bacteroidia bacterium]
MNFRKVSLRPLREMFFLSTVLGLILSCGDQKKPQPATTTVTQPAIIAPIFNADSAYNYVKAQCDFGPRVPGTKAHEACATYIEQKFKLYCPSVSVQTGVVTTYDGVRLNIKNIIASFNPQSKSRVLLFAHWDTRPWADQDSVRTGEPIMGADDAGSGVAVLLEMARQFSLQSPRIGVDLICFDAEDWGKKDGGEESEDSYALGTQFWASNTHIPGYTADYGILLDMVGAKGAQFRMEGFSKQHAQFVIDKVWKTAARLGYSDYFLYQESGFVTDDHVYVNRINIPSIDIIHSNPSTRSGFGAHWHTHRDNMDIIDRNTLKAVGQTLLEVIFSEGGAV